jgi:hypothetical protein
MVKEQAFAQARLQAQLLARPVAHHLERPAGFQAV